MIFTFPLPYSQIKNNIEFGKQYETCQQKKQEIEFFIAFQKFVRRKMFQFQKK